jgi:hypothetical protein
MRSRDPWVALLLAAWWVLPAAAAQTASRPDSRPAPDAAGLIRAGRFDEAERLLRANLERDRQDAESWLYLAIAILHQVEAIPDAPQRRIEEVIDAATRALAIRPELDAARLTRAAALARLGRWQEARCDLDEVGPAARQIDRYQQLSQQVERALRPWDLRLRLGAGWDTNVPQIGRGVVLTSPLPRKEAFRSGVGADFVYRLALGSKTEAGVGGGASADWKCGVSSFDEQSYRGMSYLVTELVPSVTAGVRYDYEFALLGREDYLSRNTVTPFVTLAEQTWGTTTLDYEFSHRRFYEVPFLLSAGPFDRTGPLQSVGLVQRFNLHEIAKRDMTLDIGYRHEKISTKGTEYDSRNEVLLARLAVPLVKDLDFECGGEWAWEEYTNRSLLDCCCRRRGDLVQTCLFALVKRFSERVSVRGEILWIDDDSNVMECEGDAPYSFGRVVYGISLQLDF